ncbi:hypothetical protein [Nostoc sp. TCL240-02]|uniref:hypothetical protein n=1 Tax=Nostoc sp. TCL240-02 TaxID=2572090 RepID=UPI00157F8DFD|nr:hypothetical protein [Nostoc sp. TCL240-02]
MSGVDTTFDFFRYNKLTLHQCKLCNGSDRLFWVKSAIAIPSTAEFQQVLDNLTSGE